MEAWRFTQRVAGLAWALLGLVLTIVMYFASAGFPGMATMDMVWSAVKCVLWELGLSVLACIAIDVVVILFYDSHGVRRELGKKK